MTEESINTSMVETKDSYASKIDIYQLIEEYEKINLEFPEDTNE